MKKNDKKTLIGLLIVALLMLAAVCGIFASASNIFSGAASSGGGGAAITSGGCSHSDTTVIFEKINNNFARHYRVVKCTSCGTSVSKTTVAHTYDRASTSVCTDCGQVCTHVSGSERALSNDDGTHRIVKYCDYCGYAVTVNASENCTLVNANCSKCNYSCPHTDTFTDENGDTCCNFCGNTLDHINVVFGFGNGMAHRLTVVSGQTWSQLLGSSVIELGGSYPFSIVNSGPDSYYPMIHSQSSNSAYIFYNGEKVKASDLVVPGASYTPGKNAAYECLVIGPHDDWSCDRIGYEPGWTWKKLCENDNFMLEGDMFTLTTEGFICSTATGARVLLDGVPVLGSDLIDGSLTYAYET